MRVGLLLCVAFAVAVSALAERPDPVVHFDGRTVSVSGLSPGGDVLIFGVAKIPLTYYSALRRWQFVVTAQDGAASVQTDIDVPVTSVWVIADLRTGEVTTATPRLRGVQTTAIGRSYVPSTADRFSFDRSFLDLLYVHAGEGAWIWHATDGGPGDEDAPNGMTTVDITKAVRITGAAAPKVFSPGGTLVAIDFSDLVVLKTDTQSVLRGQP